MKEYNRSAGRDEEHYLKELIVSHTSGRLKVAPEHTDDEVLYLMRKSSFRHFRKLSEKFSETIRSNGLKYELIPYFISAHPGTTEEKMGALARELKDLGMHPEQVQDFTPTPMTLATAMYYLGFDPYTGKKVHVTRDISREAQAEGILLSDVGHGAWSKEQGARGKGQADERSEAVPPSGRARGTGHGAPGKWQEARSKGLRARRTNEQ